jgi:hypothetical protein
MRLISVRSSLILAATFFSWYPLEAQVTSTREIDVYSRYGIGQILGGTSIAQRASGYASAAVSLPFSLNSDNPASYAALRLTTYEGAVTGSQRNVIGLTRNYKTGTATLSYLRVGFPIAKRAGIVLGLQPESRVYYRMQDTSRSAGFGRSVNEYEGSGGLNYAFLGAGIEIKGFRLGANLGYMFGNLYSTSSRQFIDADSVKAFGSEFAQYTRIGGLYTKLGAQYETPLGSKIGLRLGATAALQQSVKGTRDQTSTSIRNISGGGVIGDTAIKNLGQSGDLTLPLSYTIGAQVFGGTQWALNADLTTAQWQNFRNFGVSDSVAPSAYRIALGGEYTPNATNTFKYFQRVTYRLGFYYGLDPVRLRNTDINYLAVTAGASLPFKRTSDRIHTALEIGTRGTKSNGLVKENFVRFSVGISLNDRWFVKRRYD